MTREEAIALFEKQLTAAQVVLDSGFGSNPGENNSLYRRRKEMAEIALAALRPVSREAWTAEWTVDEVGHKCSKCGEYLPDGEDVRKPQFCPECGRAMTDEAVEMVMERLEAMYGEAKAD